MKTRLLLLLALLAMPSVVLAAGQDDPTIYVIKQGDTLWGLSDRFIKDPNYWPDMWSKNSQITNPHFIYPGQKARIFPDRIELVPAEQKSATTAETSEELHEVVAEKIYTLFGGEGFIAEKGLKPYGVVIGAQNDRILTGVDDIVYTDIGSDQRASSGDKFSVFLRGISVKHPVSDEEMGYKMIPLGTLQLIDIERKASRAIITKSFKEIGPGAWLQPYAETCRREISLKNSDIDLKGYIVESQSGVETMAAGDVVYIDLGSSMGAEAGNMLYILRDVVIDQKYVEGRVDKLPQELLGALVILETGKKTSVALVVKSIDAIYKGDRIVSQTK